MMISGPHFNFCYLPAHSLYSGLIALMTLCIGSASCTRMLYIYASLFSAAILASNAVPLPVLCTFSTLARSGAGPGVVPPGG